MKRTRKLTLHEAAFKWAAYLKTHRGRVDEDFYELSRHDEGMLLDLVKRTRWTQSYGSRQKGRGRLYEFHLALVRAFKRKHGARDYRSRSRRDIAGKRFSGEIKHADGDRLLYTIDAEIWPDMLQEDQRRRRARRSRSRTKRRRR